MGVFKCLYFLGSDTNAFTVEMSGDCVYLGKKNEERLVNIFEAEFGYVSYSLYFCICLK